MTSRSPDGAAAALASLREGANAEVLERLCGAEPVLVDVRPAGEVVPGMTRETVLTSGAPLPFEEYGEGQRNAIVGGALFEGLAGDRAEAETRIREGAISVRPCHDHGCIGSVAGIFTASMPVFVVENRAAGNRGFCNLFEGPSRYRLNYGVYNDDVRTNLLFIQDVIAPVLGEAVRMAGGVPLRPIMRRALNMGDELHSRNTAATILFERELFPALLELEDRSAADVRKTLEYFAASDYFFLRLSMAASKVTTDAARDVEGSSVVTAMAFNSRDFSIRVSGLGDEWFSAPIPRAELKVFEGFTEADLEYMGGESIINETAGLGGFAQAAAFPLQDYQGGSPELMVQRNLEMYEITVGEHPEYRIPYLRFRGTPIGIDIHRVVSTGVTPVMDIGVPGRSGGQIGAGCLRAPLECFRAAVDAYTKRYDAA